MNLKKILTPPKRWNPFWRELRAARDSARAEFEAALDRVVAEAVHEIARRGIGLAAHEAQRLLEEVRGRVLDELHDAARELPPLSPGD